MTVIVILWCSTVTAQVADTQPDLERYKPSEEEAWKIAESTREIAKIEARLAKMYGDLRILDYINDKNELFLPLRTSHLNQFEIQDSTLTEETVRIEWQNSKPVQFKFRVRTAKVRSMQTVITILQVPAVGSSENPVEPVIDFISMEMLPTGRGNQRYYILTKWDAAQIGETSRTITDNGINITFNVNQMRDPRNKIEIMQRLLDSYRYLERHLDYLINRSIHKELNDVNRYIPRS